MRLGALAQPLLHGDKITIADLDLQFADERKSGSTTYISAVKVENLQPPSPAPGAGAKPVGTTGGRIISLTDGREYQVGAALRFGREAGADVVVPGGQVSRRHAEIVASPKRLPGDRHQHQRHVRERRAGAEPAAARAHRRDQDRRRGIPVLRRRAGRSGPAAPGAAGGGAAAPPAAPRPAPAPPAAAPARPAPPAAPAKLQTTGFFDSGKRAALPDAELPPAPRPAPPPPAAPVAAAPPAPPAPKPAAPAAPAPRASAAGGPLAKFLVRSGSLKGQRLYVKVPIVNIGRADYNDMQIPDDSVSSQHAKLTRREGVWVLDGRGLHQRHAGGR